MVKQNILEALIKMVQDEDKCQTLERFLRLLENDSLKNNLNTFYEIRQNKDDIESQHREISKILDDVKDSQNQINNIYEEIFDIEDEDGNLTSQVLEVIQDIHNKAEEMQKSYQKLYGIEGQQGNVTPGILTKLTTACKQIEENEDDIAHLKEFYEKVFEGVKNQQGEIVIPSLISFLDSKQEELNELLKTKEKELTELYNKKNNDLTWLYNPTATEGLAKAYELEKQKMKETVRWWSRIFVVSVLMFIIAFGIYFYRTFDEGFNYVAFLRSLPFWFFSGFFTFYSTKQINKYERMDSEYAHKETLNKTYMGYKNQIDEIDNKNLKEKLLDIMLDSAKFNPSVTLDGKNNGEIPSILPLKELVEKVNE